MVHKYTAFRSSPLGIFTLQDKEESYDTVAARADML
jgi:hypothetical protein